MNIEDMVTFEVNGKKCVALVRKLTERECFRLMGVDEAHIDTCTCASACSTTQSAACARPLRSAVQPPWLSRSPRLQATLHPCAF